MIKKALTILIFVTLAIFPIFFSSAQLDPLVTNALTIKITPDFPTPGSSATAELFSNTIDLVKANITWTVDGKVVAKGVGEKKISFIAASRGGTNRISVSATSMQGEVFNTSVTIRPQTIDFLIEAKNQIPPWYKGARLPSSGSRVIVTAIPDFVSGKTQVNAINLYYDWRVDNRQRKDLSGKGKQTVTFVHEGLGYPKQLEVKVSSIDGTLNQRDAIVIGAQPQEVIFYEKLPSGILTSRAINSLNLNAGDSMQISAVPFFLNYSKFSDLKFDWAQNGAKINSVAGEMNTLQIDALDDSEGQAASFSVIVSNTKSLLQKIGNSINATVK